MALLWGDSSGREVALLRRRVELLEEQVAMLAKFAGMDPNHLPQARPVLDRLALSVKRAVEHPEFKAAAAQVAVTEASRTSRAPRSTP